jgi:hypothetical protein
MNRRDRLPGPAVAEQLRRAQFGVRRNETQEFATDIAGGTKDRGPNHERGPIAAFA